ncbi:DUF3800 domain-containing protein [Heliorestis convoluta]|uniref:DUF3800 domain-containing protein n=1 Tax=Heliorestis convoluta TaxID=356322 RepID=A0A5Q2MXF9_9FIRM|nr:DUF3800 domain-containing protein [Heliorestis convoluta]QGG47394.1 hypothetical protein FTV88_1247 [Heliorestis convoluta]
MNYLIYFDESNKIDQSNKDYSYYGAFGDYDRSLANLVKKVARIYKENNSKSELHFTAYKSDNSVKKYFQVLHSVLQEDIRINILIVNNNDALKAASNIGLSPKELRSLFYIKIPERLFYGIIRDLFSNIPKGEAVNVKIKIDCNDEYDNLDLNNKLIEQMNAHSAYRNKNYRVNKVISQDSNKSIPLQIIDTFMGIVVFLLEKGYTQNSTASIVKADLIYRVLSEQENILRFQEKIRLFKWTGNEELTQINISDYLSPFMVYKTSFDIEETTKLQRILASNPGISTTELRKEMNYSNRQLRLLLGYIDQIDGLGRNNFLRI